MFRRARAFPLLLLVWGLNLSRVRISSSWPITGFVGMGVLVRYCAALGIEGRILFAFAVALECMV